MVYLNRIYTKTGDDGETSLGDGTRVAKTHPRISAYGTVDELNSVLGVAIWQGQVAEPARSWLEQIQHDLFDLGADLCVPETEEPPAHTPLRIVDEQVRQLEAWIDQANAELEPLTSFILPGGCPAAAGLHLARTVCRRAEIQVLHLAEFEPVNSAATTYLNRLSDLLFVLARHSNQQGRGDVLWIPGKNRTASP
jgi:cob(I)alamin adenosyltransferase